MVGVADLDSASAEFERQTGVRPVFGGKHPSGTHNALVSLGRDSYLELIAIQPGQQGPPFFSELPRLAAPTPIGWAVAPTNEKALREQLRIEGFTATDSVAGSRITPSGATLQWHTFGLQEDLPGAPFFISWATGTGHPASTSPGGCKLDRLTVAGPNAVRLKQLARLFDGPVVVAAASGESFTVWLDCPKGKVMIPTTSR